MWMDEGFQVWIPVSDVINQSVSGYLIWLLSFFSSLFSVFCSQLRQSYWQCNKVSFIGPFTLLLLFLSLTKLRHTHIYNLTEVTFRDMTETSPFSNRNHPALNLNLKTAIFKIVDCWGSFPGRHKHWHFGFVAYRAKVSVIDDLVTRLNNQLSPSSASNRWANSTTSVPN